MISDGAAADSGRVVVERKDAVRGEAIKGSDGVTGKRLHDVGKHGGPRLTLPPLAYGFGLPCSSTCNASWLSCRVMARS